MPLRWDPLLVRHLAAELNEHLAGARLRALRLDGSTRDLVLLFRDRTLVWRLHPSRGAPELHPAVADDASDLTLKARVRAVRSLPDERILIMELLPARGRRRMDLVVELLGNQWNALVTEGPEARIRHVLVRRDKPRVLRSGAPYETPAPSRREGTTEPVTRERWLELLEPVPPLERGRELVRRVAWTSPIVSPALVDGDEDPAQALLDGYELWTRMVWDGRPVSPTLLDTPRGPQPYPFALPGTPGRPFSSLLEAFATEASEQAGGEGDGLAAALPPALVRDLEAALDSASRRLTRLEAELQGLPDPTALRAQADLLLARFADVPHGAEDVELDDFEGKRVRVGLDPTLPVHENAAALYDRAARSERGHARLPEAISGAESHVRTLETLLQSVRDGESDADAIRAALPEAGRSATPSQDGPVLPYRVYRSSGGLEIRVGRGAKSNDDLTFRHAAGHDIWLHARHAAGAHVVLRWNGPGSPPARDLQEAAVLAALHSKARTSGSVPVDWTLRKYVRKPRGARSGSVVPERVKTLFVTPDPEVGRRLEV